VLAPRGERSNSVFFLERQFCCIVLIFLHGVGGGWGCGGGGVGAQRLRRCQYVSPDAANLIDSGGTAMFALKTERRISLSPPTLRGCWCFLRGTRRSTLADFRSKRRKLLFGLLRKPSVQAFIACLLYDNLSLGTPFLIATCFKFPSTFEPWLRRT